MEESAPENDPADVTEMEVDAVLHEFGGDPRKAIAGLLHDLKWLCDGSDALVSRGYVRRPARLVFVR